MKLTALTRRALTGVKVLEFSGLAPGPFCGMILSDFGANVIRIDKEYGNAQNDCLANGKRSLTVNLKTQQGLEIIRKLSIKSDVIIDPFRAGTMEKLGLGPTDLMKTNPRLIYARLTGFGQEGAFSKQAGHDINYLAVSGVLSLLGSGKEKPAWPVNLLADFAGGGLICAFGIVMALLERTQSGQGQVIDANMVEGAAYIASWLWKSRDLPIWQDKGVGAGLNGASSFYNIYETSDGHFMSVGALEPKFYAELLKGLGLSDSDAPQFDEGNYEKFSQIFATKTRAEWSAIFDDVDACVAPVLSMDEAMKHKHNVESFTNDAPKPAPRLTRTPGLSATTRLPHAGEHSTEVLIEAGFQPTEVEGFIKDRVIIQHDNSKL